MKIGIVGNYGNKNEGDEAILAGIIQQLEDTFHIQRGDIVVFSNRPDETREKHGVQVENLYMKRRTAPGTLMRTILHHQSVIRKLDLLIIGGGGILMDLYTHGLVLFGMYGKIAQYTKTPYVIYGAGAGPIATRKGRIILRSLVKQAKLALVRDNASKQTLESIGVKRPIHVISDPAFSLQSTTESSDEGEREALHIGMTAVPYYDGLYWPSKDTERYTNYVSGMAKNIDRLLARHKDVEITLFATKYPEDMTVGKDIYARLQDKERFHLRDEWLSEVDILRAFESLDLVIGTRLHSLILALVAKKPVIGVSYHEKVNNFMVENDMAKYVIPIQSLHETDELFISLFNEMTTNWTETMEYFQAVREKQHAKAASGLALLETVLPKQ